MLQATSQSGTILDKEIFIKVLHQLANCFLEEGTAYALYSHPKDDSIHFLCASGGEVEKVSLDAHFKEEGFLISPFYTVEETNNKWFIPAKSYFCFKIADDKIVFESENDRIAWDELCKKHLKSNHQTNPSTHFNFCKPKIGFEEGTLKETFVHTVNLAKKAILENRLTKLVPARTKTKEHTGDFSIVDKFLEMYFSFPMAFVNLHYTKEFGLWMGASPEILAELKDNRYFHTVSLAGTQWQKDSSSIKDVAWMQKEIEEQALVSRYIIDCFKKIRLREYEEIGPKTVRAGHLYHLRTDFYVDCLETNRQDLFPTMVELLHPTSAVCGMPKEAAVQILLDREAFDRSLFSGYLGPINLRDASHLYVNLRTGFLLEDKVCFFAGAGITEDSDPEKEWEETEMKINTLASLF
ncbi:MAG: chorismate-binding protein [Cyclobacteriaceae bacterium]|nr:chorismate-binding protein [Cyclobacteriaceae bacterium]MCH8515750.1 chorismate-binding protein [Cyclobacteriaceae bacterium]